MALDLDDLPDAALEFLAARHLATLTTLRPDGTPHVVAVGFTFDPQARLVRVITRAGSTKVRNVTAGSGDPARGRAVVCQVDGARWLALEGVARVATDPAAVREAVLRYAGRYRLPSPSPERVAIEIAVDRVLGPR